MTAEFMFITFTLFLAGMIAVPLASRFGLGSVLGYLIAGIAIGPILHWAGVDVVALQHFTEFGVVMMLFIVGPECPVYEELAEVDKSEYEGIEGLSNIDFSYLLSGIGKSVSVSQTSQQSAEPIVPRELYGQSSWE
mgnify:CR=1 FL=1